MASRAYLPTSNILDNISVCVMRNDDTRSLECVSSPFDQATKMFMASILSKFDIFSVSSHASLFRTKTGVGCINSHPESSTCVQTQIIL